MLLEPLVSEAPAPHPGAVLALPVLLRSALTPLAVLKLPALLRRSASKPVAVLLEP